jgi:hypothetical protein
MPNGTLLMCETWLRPNRRAILFGCVPPLIVTVVGALLVYSYQESGTRPGRWIGFFCLIAGPTVIGLTLTQLSHPRVAFRDGMVLFYVRLGRPIAVPVEIVESFFFGQGPAHFPVMAKQPNTVNLIARLSQRHSEWSSQNVWASLGTWSDGYVTIRGTWCEPLNSELIRRINRRLKEVKNEIEDTSSPCPS